MSGEGGEVNNQLAEYRLQMMKKRQQQQGGAVPSAPQEATVGKQEAEILERARVARLQEVEAKQKEEQTKKPKVSEGLIEAAKKWTSEEGAKVQNKTLLSPTSMKRMEQEKMFVDVPQDEEPLSPTSIKCIIQIRLPDGNVLKAQFQSEDLLSTVCDYVIHQTNNEDLKKGIILSTGFPRRVRFEAEKLKTTTLVAAGLVPNGNVLVEKAENGYKQEEKKPAKTYHQLDYSELANSNENKLKGYTIKEIDEFKEKQRMKEMERAKREKELKKQQLRAIRAQVAAEKAERIQKNAEASASKPAITPASSSTTTSSASTATEAVLQIRLPTGSPVTITLKPGDTLYNVHEQLVKLGKISSSDKYSFIAIPRKEYKYVEWKQTTLSAIGVVPRGALIVQPADLKGKVVKGEAAPPSSSNTEEEEQDE